MGSPTLAILTQNVVIIQGLLLGTLILFETVAVNILSSLPTKPAMHVKKLARRKVHVLILNDTKYKKVVIRRVKK